MIDNRVMAAAILAPISVAGCSHTPPGWDAICSQDSGFFQYEARPSSGLALPDIDDLDGIDLLQAFYRGNVAYLEVNVPPRGRPRSEFDEEMWEVLAVPEYLPPGHWRLRAAGRSPECRKAILAKGFDPETLEYVGGREQGDNYFLSSCIQAEKIDPPAPREEESRAHSPKLSAHDWTAPYIMVREAEKHPLSDFNVNYKYKAGDEGVQIYFIKEKVLNRSDRSLVAEVVQIYSTEFPRPYQLVPKPFNSCVSTGSYSVLYYPIFQNPEGL